MDGVLLPDTWETSCIRHDRALDLHSNGHVLAASDDLAHDLVRPAIYLHRLAAHTGQEADDDKDKPGPDPAAPTDVRYGQLISRRFEVVTRPGRFGPPVQAFGERRRSVPLVIETLRPTGRDRPLRCGEALWIEPGQPYREWR